MCNITFSGFHILFYHFESTYPSRGRWLRVPSHLGLVPYADLSNLMHIKRLLRRELLDRGFAGIRPMSSPTCVTHDDARCAGNLTWRASKSKPATRSAFGPRATVSSSIQSPRRRPIRHPRPSSTTAAANRLGRRGPTKSWPSKIRVAQIPILALASSRVTVLPTMNGETEGLESGSKTGCRDRCVACCRRELRIQCHVIVVLIYY